MASAHNTANTATILVVEDDNDIRFMQQELLSAAGYRVQVATNGQDALAQLALSTVDLVVLDIRLPDIDGITVCERIRAENSNSATPVLMLSANSTHESIASALAAGADAYLIKPFVPDALFEQLTLLLHRS